MVSRAPRPVTVDFETERIERRPDYPPKPVGVSIQWPGERKPRYLAWGHPTKNNCKRADAVRELRDAWKHRDGVLFHNAKFDLDVAEVHLGLRMLPWERVHDTMLLLFLNDPHQRDLGLKPSAELLLGLKPDERDALGDWLVEHQPVPGVKLSRSPKSPNFYGGYVAYAPGDLAGKYANGDTLRTARLFRYLLPAIKKRGMLGAYDRERELLLNLLDMERQGLPVRHRKLKQDVKKYAAAMDRIEAWLDKKLGQGINLNSGDQLMRALLDNNMVHEDRLELTPGGKYKTGADALDLALKNRQVAGILRYRGQLSTCLNTFMRPWLEMADRSSGFIFTTWHQTRSSEGMGAGARTGRLSSSPNFQNIPNSFDPIFKHDDPKHKGLPTCPIKDLPPLPRIRGYVAPFPGDVLIDRDYSQQEPRILAHFDGGDLMQQYLDEPWTDVHDYAKAELANMGKYYGRKPVKNTNLGLIYGMGVPVLAAKNDMEVGEAAALKKAVLALYPGLREMQQDMKVRAKNDEPIRTWGGREYYCEPPKIVNGRFREFDYKMVNVLIQGSAADCTKEAINRFYRKKRKLKKDKQWKLLLNVHDQLTASVPTKQSGEAMTVLCDSMESVEFDVQMLTEGKISARSWDDLRDYDKRGERV